MMVATGTWTSCSMMLDTIGAQTIAIAPSRSARTAATIASSIVSTGIPDPHTVTVHIGKPFFDALKDRPCGNEADEVLVAHVVELSQCPDDLPQGREIGRAFPVQDLIERAPGNPAVLREIPNADAQVGFQDIV